MPTLQHEQPALSRAREVAETTAQLNALEKFEKRHRRYPIWSRCLSPARAALEHHLIELLTGGARAFRQHVQETTMRYLKPLRVAGYTNENPAVRDHYSAILANPSNGPDVAKVFEEVAQLPEAIAGQVCLELAQRLPAHRQHEIAALLQAGE